MYIINDLHGNPGLVEKAVNGIKAMTKKDVVMLNGDIAGARGPVQTEVAKQYYEVRRGERAYGSFLEILEDIVGERVTFPKEWVYNSVHAGMFRALMSARFDAYKKNVEKELREVIADTMIPLAEAAKEVGVKLIYLAGNGEIVPSDLSIRDITFEQALPPEERFYQKLDKEGYFKKIGVEYVPYVYNLHNEVALISTNLLDLDTDVAIKTMKKAGLIGAELKTVIVHYPPMIDPIEERFKFWKPNIVDVFRADALNMILNSLRFQNGMIFFGHIHLPATDERMEKYPAIIRFGYGSNDAIWVKPGEVVEVK